MKINTEAIKAWVAALRSGKYEQAKRALRTDEGYCCLGVACEVYKELTGKGKWIRDDIEGDSIGYEFQDGWGYADRLILPQKVVNFFFGTDDSSLQDPSVKHFAGRDDSLSLSAFNDGGYSFEVIAKLIEDNEACWESE